MRGDRIRGDRQSTGLLPTQKSAFRSAYYASPRAFMSQRRGLLGAAPASQMSAATPWIPS